LSSNVLQRLKVHLAGRQVAYAESHHVPVYTSEEAAKVRGTPLSSGAKALVCKADERFVMIVLPADRRLASKDVRKSLGIKSLRFATREEVEQLTGLAPGSIPPFGSLFGLETWCDERLGENDRINFNAGDHSVSISLRYSDYVAAEQPKRGLFAE
jgi:Ala-tRNA(Pro) deacylase